MWDYYGVVHRGERGDMIMIMAMERGGMMSMMIIDIGGIVAL